MGKRIRVCKKCCGFDVKLLVDKVKADDLSTGCNGRCLKKYPELEGKACGFIDGDFVVCSSAEEFLARIDVLEENKKDKKDKKKDKKSKKDKTDKKKKDKKKDKKDKKKKDKKKKQK